jgi:phosphate:Na+ symporter
MVLQILSGLTRILGALCLFLYGMKVMGDGIQQSAGDRLQRVLGFMTGNRFIAVLTGFLVTAIIQSSGATTVMVVSFVNAGLLTLTQAIGVIMGANIGTTVTAWIVSIVGFTLSISSLALPAIGLGFILRAIKWKHQATGDIALGFGMLFLGLDFLTKSMPTLDAGNLSFITALTDRGFLSVLIGMGIGLLVTVIIHSSSASTAIVLTLAYSRLIDYHIAAAMILGANIGSTVDAALAAIGTKTAAKRAALVHVLFNVIGTLWALLLFNPLLSLVDHLVPGPIEGNITVYLAMLHTTFNLLNTLLFFPFVKPFARLVSFIIKERPEDASSRPYTFAYTQVSMRDAPELSILRAEKEIRDMAGLVFSMYRKLSAALRAMNDEAEAKADYPAVAALVPELYAKEDYADQMREALTAFLMECTRRQLNRRSEHNVSLLLRIIADLEDMTDDCYSVSLLLQRSVKKNQIFKNKEINALIPYMALVEQFLAFVGDHLGASLAEEQRRDAVKLEEDIDASRDKLRKLGRKRIEAGADVKTELLFIDLVRRIEKLGDYCYSISQSLSHIC